MHIFPAIDIIDGSVVRLTKGDYESVKKYALSPEEAARSFRECGATCMHVVDLDGARSGNADNAETIERIVKKYDMFVEVGGGIRSEEQIKKYLGCGVGRIIFGTVAVKNPDFVASMVAKYGDKISVGVDAKDGKVAVSGWEEVTSFDSVDFCRNLENMGVKHIIYTDISRDGCLSGTNIDIYRVLCQTLSLNITASGGITDLEEIKELRKLNLYGAIIGKALYEGRLNLREAITVSGG